VTGTFIIDSYDIGEAEEFLSTTYTKLRLSEQLTERPPELGYGERKSDR
jgi:hypothetical protein